MRDGLLVAPARATSMDGRPGSKVERTELSILKFYMVTIYVPLR